MADPIVVKPSWKSASFWFCVSVAICGIFVTLGGIMKDKPYMVIVGTVASAVIVAINSIANAFKNLPTTDGK